MLKKTHWWALGLAAGLALAGLAGADDPLAFVTEIKGAARIGRADGTSEAAKVGARLFAGDALRVDQGEAVLIYLSGRSAKVAAGQEHQVQAEAGKPSALVARLRETLDEINAPQDAKAGPVVHGMARDLVSITNARPANTWLSSPDFAFVWDPVEGVAEYDFTLATSQGETVLQKTVKGHRLPAADLPLERGRRYVWKVLERDSFMVGSGAGSWVEIVPEKEAETLRQTLKEVEKNYKGETQSLLQAAVLYQGGFYHEARALLEARQARRELSQAEKTLLGQIRAKTAP